MATPEEIKAALKAELNTLVGNIRIAAIAEIDKGTTVASVPEIFAKATNAALQTYVLQLNLTFAELAELVKVKTPASPTLEKKIFDTASALLQG